MPHPAGKLGHLREILQGMERVTIAFSGGIDSSFLLRSACLALGAKNVAAFQAVSCLTGSSRREKARTIIRQLFTDLGHYREVEVDPLSWPEVCANTSERRRGRPVCRTMIARPTRVSPPDSRRAR